MLEWDQEEANGVRFSRVKTVFCETMASAKVVDILEASLLPSLEFLSVVVKKLCRQWKESFGLING